MALLLFLQYFGSPLDELSDNDLVDVISGGYQCVKETFLLFHGWLTGNEIDPNEIAEVTQSFALRVLVFTYTTISWVIQFSCALIIYIFTDADTVPEAVEYVRPSKSHCITKSITSLINYEKQISFDFNPFHWIFKAGKLLFIGPLMKVQSHEGQFITPGKIFAIGVVSFFIYRTFSATRKENVQGAEYDVTNEPSKDGDSTSPQKYEGSIKWEAGLVRCDTDKQNDQLSLKISVNSNICSENQGLRYDEMIASSTASICKIVSDILSNAPIGSQELSFEKSLCSTPRRTEEPEVEDRTGDFGDT
ncbi:hypothetical protein RUM43_011945 [Polyplax serrata]|uniref:Uncharacterized protein n=1 Tax=Polyplax serrata TaxID=468196 RepID=A0AAN8S6N8_POLSC